MKEGKPRAKQNRYFVLLNEGGRITLGKFCRSRDLRYGTIKVRLQNIFGTTGIVIDIYENDSVLEPARGAK